MHVTKMGSKLGVMVFFTAVSAALVVGWSLAKRAGADAGVVSWFEGATLIVLGLFLIAAIVNRMWEP